MDYGRAVRFGYFPEPLADDIDDITRRVQMADRAGLDLIAIQDHPYQRRFMETWTLLTWLAARTERIGLATDVANLPLRPPAVLAKAAASLDLLSKGRFDLGLGAGGFWDAIEGMGGPRRAPGEAVQAVEEAIAVLRAMWSGERGLRVAGEYYHLGGIHSGPVPGRPVQIWLGAVGPRMLGVTGRLADGWIPSSPHFSPERLLEAHDRIDQAAADAGREAAAVRRLYNVSGQITSGSSAGFLEGPVDQWVEELTDLVMHKGMDTFILWPSIDPDLQVRRFAEEVAPAVRAVLDKERGATG